LLWLRIATATLLIHIENGECRQVFWGNKVVNYGLWFLIVWEYIKWALVWNKSHTLISFSFHNIIPYTYLFSPFFEFFYSRNKKSSTMNSVSCIFRIFREQSNARREFWPFPALNSTLDLNFDHFIILM
jgi:hypothetical protein